MADDAGEATGWGPWIADIAANLLCVVVVVLALAALAAPAPPPPVVSEARRAAPLSGAEAVAMLHDRVAPGAGSARVVDLLPAGPRRLNPEGAARVDLFVFDHAAYAARAPSGLPERELSVPAALRRPDGADWAPAFLALSEVGRDRAAFAEALVSLLSAQPGAADPPPPAGRRALLARLAPWANGLVAAGMLGLLLLMRRRRVRA